ncbi:MAG: 30S ribosomal protein S1 [Spirochaetales bacterium]|jgi:small subunit ribosomal protein S1|nr:30S ribosomal protein S1 [Spirochaetales bacterium]
MVVAIDGPAGVGKSSVAKMIAQKRGFLFLNSGEFYRAVTWKAMNGGSPLEDEGAITDAARNMDLSVRDGKLFLDGVCREEELHTDRIDAWVAKHSAIVAVRHEVNRRLREIASTRDVVMEGRDIATVVLPGAEIKIFLDAKPEARARRRFLQGTSGLSEAELAAALRERDSIDANKEEGSLTRDRDALYIDTSDLTLNEVCEKVLALVPQKKITGRGNMAENENKASEAVQSPSQEELQEQYLKTLDDLEEGQLVEGRVVEVGQENVFVDVGYKSEGKIPIHEFPAPPEIGDTVQVVLMKKENRAGELIVSKQKADEKLFWKQLKSCFQEHKPIKGKITKTIKGGFEVDLGFGISGFNPISKIDIHRVEDPEKYVGLESSFLVERIYNENRINIILSRRNWLEEETIRKREDFFANTQIGDEVEGTVKSFTSFGAFVDLGGFDGLLHINDMSWGHVTRPKDYVKKGQEIRLKVIKLDTETQKINLSLKHFEEDPWMHFEENFAAGDVIKGRVTKLADFGAFIELAEGIEGLAHISEFSWVKRINHPREILKVGDEVEAKILAYDINAGRISLGLKQVHMNPWDEIGEKYPRGMRLTRKVKKVTGSGAFIELEEGIDGFLHADDLSWTKKIKNPGSVLKEGEDIEVIVIDIYPEERNIRLGMKQLSEDPWISLKKAYPERSIIEGEITNITDFGIFVKVQGGIEGLISKMNVAERASDDADAALKKFSSGDKIKAVVLEINSARQKLALSLREFQKKQQREELQKYIQDEDSGSTFTLGDFLKDKENA